MTRGLGTYGRGLALAGMATFGLGVIAACASSDGGRLVTGTVQSGPLLTVGECFNETPQSEIPGAEVGDGINEPVRCDQPHSDEVFALLSLSHFPDGDADQDELVKRCTAELPKYSASASRDPSVRVVMSTPGTDWKYMNNHTSGCLVHFTSDRLGSVKG